MSFSLLPTSHTYLVKTDFLIQAGIVQPTPKYALQVHHVTGCDTWDFHCWDGSIPSKLMTAITEHDADTAGNLNQASMHRPNRWTSPA